MPMQRWTVWLVLGSVFGVVVACGETDYTKGVYDKKYATPDSLRNANAPDPYNPALDGGEAGTTGAALCDGKGPIDGGACTVSFKTDILPKLVTDCGACHTATGGITPQIDNASAEKTYANFIKQGQTKPIDNKPYINPCSTDKATSTILCNMSATGTCGQGMPQGKIGQLSTDLAAKLDTWLTCGSPNN